MTPEERKLVTDLFDRLAALEDAPRDPEAERLIRDGLRQAPNAVYALVQTVLVQDEALKRADAHIRELEGGAEPPRDKSFLGGVRDTLLGSRGSVPSVRPPESPPSGLSPAWRTEAPPSAPSSAWRTGAQPMAPAPGPEPAAAAAAPGRGGSSFLGTAAAAAAGMIGGSLLLSGIRGMMGGGAGGAHAAFNPTGGGSGGGSPWGGGGGSIAGSDLSRQAGLDDMGRPPSGGGSGLFDATGSDAPYEEESGAGDFDDDLGDMTGGGGDDD
jgi:hypothetical protein